MEEVLGTHRLHDQIFDGETDRSGTSLRTGATGSNREVIDVSAGWPRGAGLALTVELIVQRHVQPQEIPGASPQVWWRAACPP